MQLLRAEHSAGELTDQVLEELMDAEHSFLGHHVLSEWHLPEPICRAILHHHDDNAASSDDRLVIRVQAADAVARKMGAHPNPQPDLDLSSVIAVDSLQLSDVELASLLVDLEDEIAEMRSMHG